MLFGFIIIISGMAILMLLERIFPDKKLKYVKGWWVSVILINIYQLIIVVIGIYTWEKWVQSDSLLNLSKYIGPELGGFIAYFISTWIFYWWHRARHEIYPLWLLCHQVHHSAQRIEAITSFYKHPVEILLDSIIMSILLYPILGFTAQSSIWLSCFSAFGEYFYHMNIKTPHWIGYFFQRPESHRLHHDRNKRINCPNHSDFPLWDILGGTFKNPKETDNKTGFKKANEMKRKDMLFFRDVLIKKERKKKISYKKLGYTIILLIVLSIGCLHFVGYIFNSTSLRGIAFATGASPLPLVFTSYNDIETFSTSFIIKVETMNNTKLEIPMNRKLYTQIIGPYNRRNVYGVMFSHGPFFKTENQIALRQQILHYGICQGNLKFDFNIDKIKKMTIITTSNTNKKDNKWTMEVIC